MLPTTVITTSDMHNCPPVASDSSEPATHTFNFYIIPTSTRVGSTPPSHNTVSNNLFLHTHQLPHPLSHSAHSPHPLRTEPESSLSALLPPVHGSPFLFRRTEPNTQPPKRTVCITHDAGVVEAGWWMYRQTSGRRRLAASKRVAPTATSL